MSSRPEQPFAKSYYASGAFTLIELLTVLGIILVISAFIAPAVTGLKDTNDITSAAAQIQGALDQARTYAVSYHDYTWVGFFEEDSSKGNTTPATSGVGRLIISIVASKDGTTIYTKPQAGASTPASQTIPPSRLVQIGKLIRLENIHVLDATGQTIGKRQAGTIRQEDLVGLSTQPLLFNFQYPLNGAAVYTFGTGPVQTPGGQVVLSGIVQFNPQGEASSEAKTTSGMVPCREISIQQSRGTLPTNSKNIIAIDISGLTGKTTLYRP